MPIHFKELEYGFEWGAAKVERHISDDKQGWIIVGLETPKRTLQIYVTKTGKVRIINYKTGEEYYEAPRKYQRRKK